MENQTDKDNDFYQQLIENMLIGFTFSRIIFEHGKPVDYVYLNANKAFEDLTGLRNVIGKKITELLPGIRESNPDLFAIYERVALSGLPENIETYIPPLNVWLNISVHSPEKEHIVAMFENITERKDMEEALRESEAKWKSLFSILPAGVSILDKSCNIVDFNKELGQILAIDEDGLKNHQYAHRSYYRTDGALMQPEEFPSVRAVKEQRVIKNVELKVTKENGEMICTLVSAAPLNLPGISCVVSTTDITRLKAIEGELIENRNLLKSIIDGTTDVIYAKDVKGRYILLNKASERFTGKKSEDILGKDDSCMFPEGEAAVIMKGDNEVLSECKLRTFEENVTTSGGKITTFLSTKGPIIDQSGRTIGLFGISRDITEWQRMLLQLQQAQKLESLGVLAGGIAHDFNNLMGGILGLIELANEEQNSKIVSKYLNKALSTIDRARNITTQLLTFAKGGAPVQKNVHLIPFIQNTAQISLSRLNMSCKFDISADLSPCNIDETQITQVIDNILINSKQAMINDSCIEITAKNITLSGNEHCNLASGSYVKISITDTGKGIPQNIMSRIFDPFFTTKEKSHGLGLTICYSIINRHGGAIDVESEEGKGSTFHLYLPACSESEEAGEVPVVKHKHKGKTIIVMDDEEVMRETISKVLESLGYSAICKDDGREVVSFFNQETKAEHSITGLFLDLTVPGGFGGKAVVEEIRKIDSEIPVFVASGYADDPVMKNPKKFGFTASICKPFRKFELAQMLDMYLKE